MKTTRTLRSFLGSILVGGAAAVTLALAAGEARADARADVKDLGAGKLPVRHELLGWAEGGAAVLRTLVCAEGGTTSSKADLVIPAARPSQPCRPARAA